MSSRLVILQVLTRLLITFNVDSSNQILDEKRVVKVIRTYTHHEYRILLPCGVRCVSDGP